MAYTNSLNAVWNEAHNGARVPINDTGIPGAPSALNASLPEWTQGSVNKAVVDTWLLHGEFPDIDKPDAENGTLDLLRCTRFVVTEMLWGFGGDSQYKRPGDMMSFRGYPTSVVLEHTAYIEEPYSNKEWYPDGAIGSNGRFTIYSSKVTLKYKVPYDFVYKVIFKQGTTIIFEYDIKIAAGSFAPTHYKLTTSEVWLPLVDGKIFFSFSTVGYSGDLEFSVLAGDVIQEPFYGVLDDLTDTVAEADYNPLVLPIAVPIGAAFRCNRIDNINCYLENCSEISQQKLYYGNDGVRTWLFVKDIFSFELGAPLWLDNLASVPAPEGKYLWAFYSYTPPQGEGYDPNSGDIYKIWQYVRVDNTGKIASIYKEVDAGGPNCWLNSFCG